LGKGVEAIGGGLTPANFPSEAANSMSETPVPTSSSPLPAAADCVVKRAIRRAPSRGELETGATPLSWMIEAPGAVDVVDEG
jgi:hypothetical protein